MIEILGITKKFKDIEVLKGLSKMLGSMDLEGQINNIDLINELLKNQIQ